MARKAMVEKNNANRKLAQKFAKYRKELREKAVDMKVSDEDRALAREKLQGLPRDTSYCRVTTRCSQTGRARGNYRKFGLSRLAFRKLALLGQLPGVTKASW